MIAEIAACKTLIYCGMTNSICDLQSQGKVAHAAHFVWRNSAVALYQPLFYVATNVVKPYVPWVWVDLISFLTGERNTDELRA